MSVKSFRVVAAVGAALIVVGALAACNDSTTASAPIGTGGVTTTSVQALQSDSMTTSSSPSSSATPSEESSEASKQAQEGASRAAESGPATAPQKSTTAPRNFPGIAAPSGVQLNDSEKAYLAELKRQKVEFMGDTDNSVALTMGEYVCTQRRAKTDETMIKAFVTAAIGPMTDNEADAMSRADKVIRAADSNLC